MSTVETIKEFFVHSGAEWVLWLLFALSCLSLGVALERFILFRQKSDDLRGLVGTFADRSEPKSAYLWKGGKWLRALEFRADDQLGFWEQNGYHNEADPWTEQRFARGW